MSAVPPDVVLTYVCTALCALRQAHLLLQLHGGQAPGHAVHHLLARGVRLQCTRLAETLLVPGRVLQADRLRSAPAPEGTDTDRALSCYRPPGLMIRHGSGIHHVMPPHPAWLSRGLAVVWCDLVWQVGITLKHAIQLELGAGDGEGRPAETLTFAPSTDSSRVLDLIKVRKRGGEKEGVDDLAVCLCTLSEGWLEHGILMLVAKGVRGQSWLVWVRSSA
jgi:hypothetical protein